ncbi:MAG: hypothetical protein C4560_02470 [Nitrospiraceae bacterium]|nr:MAG: hypothetical protein C4560_02470 [Nitrospiraceae bacterium]
MNVMCVIIAFMLITVPFTVTDIQASLQGKDPSLLQIRAGNHSEFLRIVIEGPDQLISKGKVSKKGRGIEVIFSGEDFEIRQNRLPVSYTRSGDAVLFALNNESDIKVFNLDGPSRIVIDAFHKTGPNPGTAVEEKTEDADKVEKRPLVKSSHENAGPTVSQKAVTSVQLAALQAGQTHKKIYADRESGGYVKDSPYEYGFITDKYKKIWSVLKAENNPYKVIKELSAGKPGDAESLGVYHYIYGEALSAAKRELEAINQLRLAFIYSTDQDLKETAFLRRAEIYQKAGLMYEARSNYLVFFKEFPSSKYIAKAHLGMAKSLSETGFQNEAVEHYGNAGRSPEVLFSMANALQKLGRAPEAGKAYANAMLADSAYPQQSPETYYLIGENMRMTGKINEAEKHLSAINTGPFRDSANISLGLIAMEEPDYVKAIEYFKAAAYSKDRKTKVEALLNLSLAYFKADKLKESISTLEEVRHNHYDSTSSYKETLFLLSRLYRKTGMLKESVSLLKELVYGKEPPAEVLGEIEAILLEAGDKTATGPGGDVRFTDLWREFGQWMLDGSREEFLMKIARRLKPEGKPFIDLCSWLVENTQGKAKTAAAIELAEYYAGLDRMQQAEKYLGMVRDSKVRETGDDVFRLEAKINQAAKNTDLAFRNLAAIKEFESGDFKLLGRVITGMKEAQSDNVQKAVALYEKMINKFDADAGDYVRLADIYYDYEKDDKALAYYRAAYEKNPGDEWAMYRIGSIVGTPETNEMFGKLQKGDTLISRLAKTKLRGMNILNRIDEVYQ